MMDWKEKVVIITGGSRSLGKSIALSFAQLGATVIIGYRSSLEEATDCVNEIQRITKNKNVSFKKIDVTDGKEVQKAFIDIIEKEGKIDVLVNNAALSNAGAILTTPLDHWEEIIDTNIIGTINCIKAASSNMLLLQKGVIINISSVAGLVGMDRLGVYSATKSGVIGLTRSLGKEFAPYNVRINAIAPGYIEGTGMVNRIPEKQREELKNKIAMQRFGEASEIAETVVFLSSDKASYITGQTLVVDGGLV